MAKSWPGPVYRLQAEFDAPVGYVFRWCTDYTPDDAKLEHDDYERRIVRRSSREVVYEDLQAQKSGWFWARHVVRLLPPNRWHSETVGSHRMCSLDYRLKELPGNRTRLTLTARRRPYGVGGPNPPKAEWERAASIGWKRFGRALEREYRNSRAKHRAT